MTFDVFPSQFDGEAPSAFENFVDNVVLGAEARSCKGRGGSESSFNSKNETLIVCGDSDPRCVVGLNRRIEVKKLVAIEKDFDEHEKGELAGALGTEGVGEPAGGDSTTFPEKV